MNKKSNSIILLVNSTHGGGAENSMRLLHQSLLLRDVKSNLCAINNMPESESQMISSVKYLQRNWSDGIVKTIKSIIIFNRYLSTFEKPVIVLNCEIPELFGVVTRLHAERIIAVEHTSKPWFKRRTLGWAVRLILRGKRVEWVTVNSSQEKIWPFRDNPYLILNPIRPTIDSYNRSIRKELIFVGRLRSEKRPEVAINAAIRNNIPITIFGDGQLRSKLEEANKGIHFVKFKGYQDNPWVTIDSNCLVIVPSEYEGDGIVVLEALQNNCGILLADNQDLRRFNFPEENYFQDDSSLDIRIRAFLDDASIFRLGQEFRQEVLRPRQLENYVTTWVNFLTLASDRND